MLNPSALGAALAVGPVQDFREWQCSLFLRRRPRERFDPPRRRWRSDAPATMHLTNKEPRPHSCAVTSDFSEATGAPVNEVKITPEMIEAGTRAFRPHWADIKDCIDGAAAKMVMDVFLAMAGVEQDRSEFR
jgi:hypothetical protein